MTSSERARLHAKESRRKLDQKYSQSAKGKARTRTYNASAKGKLRYARSYFNRRAKGQSAHEARGIIKVGDPKETTRRLEMKKLTCVKASRRFTARWGRVSKNPLHRHRWEMIREGLWVESEHPL